jgi:xylose isomerase
MPEAIRRAGEVGGLVSLDLNYPFWGRETSKAEIIDALAECDLRAAALTPEIYTQEFRDGAFTNPDPEVRRSVRRLIDEAADVGREMGVDYVKLWPGQDGFDYPLQADHRELWDLSVTGIREVAAARPDMRFAIEYKPKEPRTHIVLANAAKTLLAIEEIGLDNVGILMDVGHSLYAGESPADAVQLIIGRDRLFGIDFNDNFRSWDDDLTVGSVHLVETLEFLLALRRHQWQGIWQLDQFPYREDPVAAARSSIRVLRALNALAGRIDLGDLERIQDRQDALEAQLLIQRMLFGDLFREELA